MAPLRFVNGGGTGSVERTAAEAAVTEVAAGSGLYGPTLFDAYGAFSPEPAALFALPVVRRPDDRTATLLGGGYPASGAAGADRLPRAAPPGGAEARPPGGRGRGADAAARPGRRGLRVGDRVWMRHAKAGELCERFNELHLVRGERARGDGADVPRRGRGVPVGGLTPDASGPLGLPEVARAHEHERRGEPGQRERDGDQQQLVEAARERRLVGRAQAVARAPPARAAWRRRRRRRRSGR